jgi:hypothetical protein
MERLPSVVIAGDIKARPSTGTRPLVHLDVTTSGWGSPQTGGPRVVASGEPRAICGASVLLQEANGMGIGADRVRHKIERQIGHGIDVTGGRYPGIRAEAATINAVSTKPRGRHVNHQNTFGVVNG